MNGTLLLDAGLASKAKQAGEAHLAGKKLYASFSTKNLSKKLADDTEQIKLGINSGSVSIQGFEVGMVGLKGISVVDLSVYKNHQPVQGTLQTRSISLMMILRLKASVRVI